MVDMVTNLFVSALMGWALYMGMRLDKRLRLFQKQRENLDQLIQSLQATLIRAEAGMKDLQEISHSQGNTLQEAIVKARQLQDELSFVIAHGEKLSARLEEGITHARSHLPQSSPTGYGASFAPLPPQPTPIEVKTSASLDPFKSLENLR